MGSLNIPALAPEKVEARSSGREAHRGPSPYLPMVIVRESVLTIPRQTCPLPTPAVPLVSQRTPGVCRQAVLCDPLASGSRDACIGVFPVLNKGERDTKACPRS